MMVSVQNFKSKSLGLHKCFNIRLRDKLDFYIFIGKQFVINTYNKLSENYCVFEAVLFLFILSSACKLLKTAISQ